MMQFKYGGPAPKPPSITDLLEETAKDMIRRELLNELIMFVGGVKDMYPEKSGAARVARKACDLILNKLRMIK